MATPLINGVNYSWASVSVILFGVPLVGITSVSFKRKQAKTNNYGAGVDPVGRGHGKKEYEGSIEIYLDELKKVISAAPGRDILDIPAFDILIKTGNSASDATIDILKSCEFTEDPFDAKHGDTALTVKLPLVIGLITR